MTFPPPARESGHTPGPWENNDGLIGCMINGRREWSAIAAVSYEPDQNSLPGEGAANARLIAAAPDLLAALQGFNIKEKDIRGGTGTALIVHIPMATIIKAAEAIAKATSPIPTAPGVGG